MSLQVAMFYHSLVSDWNHGNAHFLRGVATELQELGHEVRIYEPNNAWSLTNLLNDHGQSAIQDFERTFPALRSRQYELQSLDLERELDDVDLILVHEWNDPELVARIGDYRRTHRDVRVFFHDTHHRAITANHEMSRFELNGYDGVLAYGQSLKVAYESLGWGKQVYVWHEAADTRVFHPLISAEKAGDVVWVGNWGDDERTQELNEYLIEPVRDLALNCEIYGVRYPQHAIELLSAASIRYRGWLANAKVPFIFSHFRATLHVPRRPYTRQLSGIPTIRPFEALACGIPLVSAPWSDSEGLFRVGRDFLMASNGTEMREMLYEVLNDSALANALASNGLETVRARHTCAHRVRELMDIYSSVAPHSALQQLQPMGVGA